MAQNKGLVADAQTLLEENLSEKKSVESARRLLRCDFQVIAKCDFKNYTTRNGRSPQSLFRMVEKVYSLTKHGH